jgi:hypothetical protein
MPIINTYKEGKINKMNMSKIIFYIYIFRNLSIKSNQSSQLKSLNNFSGVRNSNPSNKFAEIGQKLISTPISDSGKTPDMNRRKTPVNRSQNGAYNNYHFYNQGK